MGDPLDKNTDIGAINSAAQLARIRELADSGDEEGITRWSPPCELPEHGFWFAPTVFTGVSQASRIAREEIFGPVLATIRFKDAEDAIAKGNATVYGLAAAVWTRDISKAHRIAKSIKAGTVWINSYNLYDPALPFGGFKESGFGRDQGRDALEKYTQTKSVWVNL